MTKNITYHLSRTYCKAILVVKALLFSNVIISQTDTSANTLNEVVISDTKTNTLLSTKKQNTFDSVLFIKYNSTSLANLLANEAGIHIKMYGNNNLATISMRGGNANHTAVLWNGLNIQNPMLGMIDLNLIPTLLFDNASVQFGGSSSVWGSGAVSGAINLNNNGLFNKGFFTKTQISTGSFNTNKFSEILQFSEKRFNSTTKLYYTSSDNNYKYIDTLDKEHPNKQLSHANYITKGVLQEFGFKLNEYNKLTINGWYNYTHRFFSATYNINNEIYQHDENLKLTANWHRYKYNLKTGVKFGFFNDVLNYSDTAQSIVSNSATKTVITESTNEYNHKNHSINFNVNATSYLSNTKNYAEKYTLHKLSFLAGYQVKLLRSKLLYTLSIRKEATSIGTIPFTGVTGFVYIPQKNIGLKVNAAKTYRQPTLNELYWINGGNPNLKPEQGCDFDGGIELKHQSSNLNISIETTYFNRHTTDWIMWLPNSKGSSSPVNIPQVYSRGLETKTKINFLLKKYTLTFLLNTSYVLSTNQKQLNENDKSVGRQLVYTPRYNGNASLILQHKSFGLLINQTYTGYRFTSSDNTSWLYPYYICNVKMNYSLKLKSTSVEMFAAVNNAFNKNYKVVSTNPMPMRNYEIGLAFNYYKSKKQNNQ